MTPVHDERRTRPGTETLVPLLQGLFVTETAEHWLSALEGAGVPCAPVRTLDEVFTSPEGRAPSSRSPDFDLVADPIKVDGERLPARLRPPHLGEHTEDVLGSRKDP
jgi:crotonobetainyl-CoA:carnitine CoA-transferase CaiB-like acyl-CoA transferase